MSNEQQAHDLQAESLSALMDGEASEMELHRALKLDEASRQKWSRYHLAREAMQDDFRMMQPIDVSVAVSAAVDAEPALQSNGSASVAPASTTNRGKLWGNIGRFGIAASVAGAIVLGVQLSNTTPEVNVADSNTSSQTANPVLGSGTSLQVVSQQPQLDASEQERLKREQLLREQEKLNAGAVSASPK